MLIPGDVIDVDLGLPAGHEPGFARPVVVVTAQAILQREPNVIQVVPLTSTLREFGSEVRISGEGSGLDRDSNAQCQHIRSVAGSSVLRRRGNVGSVDLARIRELAALLIDI
ncbi:MAG TPA: type II toxin-antitoxin system PemK/MazF family toxin [Actinomycetota bacterium]|nr:type II toxin-antitoxin system PemK/MazF family toxin [Actinomycetota bacterium]